MANVKNNLISLLVNFRMNMQFSLILVVISNSGKHTKVTENK